MKNCDVAPRVSSYSVNNNVAALQKLLDSSLDIICSVGKDGKFITINAASKKMLGYEPEELIGKNYMDLVVQADKDSTCRIANAAMTGSEISNFENHCLRKDGKIISILWSARWDFEENIMYLTGRDSTETQKQKQKEKEYEHRLFIAYKLARIGWWEWDALTNENHVSDELHRIYGTDKNTFPFTVEDYLKMVPAQEREMTYKNIQLCSKLDAHEYDHKFIKPGGELIHVIHYVKSVKDSKGTLLKIYGTTKDITERKKRELATIESEKRIVNILESIQEGFFVVDKNWKVTYWNKKAEEILGKTKEEILGKNLWQEYRDAMPLKFYSEYHRAVSENSAVHFEEMLPSLNIWFEVAAYPSEDGLSVYFKDITQRRKMQEAVMASEEKYKMLFYKSPTPKWVFDYQSLAFIDVNDAAIQLYGYSKEEFMSMTVLDIRPKEDVALFKKIKSEKLLESADGLSNVFRHKKKNGEVFNVAINCFPVDLQSGMHNMTEITDLSEKIELHKMVIEEKIAAQKEVSKAIITTQEKERSEIGKELHDNVNQILTTAKLYVENIEYYPDRSKEFVSKSRELLTRSINEIRFLARQLVTPVIHDIGFKATIDELIEHYRSLDIFRIRLLFTLGEQNIEKDMQLTLYRIIQEQLNNIIKYAKASQVDVSLKEVKTELKLSIRDNGVGFDVLKNTSGIGLRNIRNRVEVFKGKMQIKTSPGGGCELIITLPKQSR